MRYLIFILLLIWPATLWAQQDRSDEGFLVRLIEDNLSGVSREVRLTGFRGALSSQATLDRLTVADDIGIWLTIEDATLNWNRQALLSGELIVQELTAARIILSRFPQAAPTAPSAEATEFSLPELPVSVDIDLIQADQIVIGAPILGQEARFSIRGATELIGGAGELSVQARRTDGTIGRFDLNVGYSNETNMLSVALNLQEGRQGLISTLAGLHGAPSLSLTAQGEGPLADFATDIRLATDGQQRLTGTVALRNRVGDTPDAPPTQVFNANLNGDVAVLFAPDFRPFFGPDVQMQVTGERLPSGRITLNDLLIQAAALRLSGRAAFNPDGWPELLEIEGLIADPRGGKTRLPVGGAPLLIDRASLLVLYDQTQGEGWLGRMGIAGVEHPDVTISALTLIGGGTIQPGDAQTIGRVSTDFKYAAQQMIFQDTALTAAIGPQIEGRAVVNLTEGQALQIPVLTVQGADYSASGLVQVGLLDDGLPTDLNLNVTFERLSRFSPLVGRPVQGTARANLSGRVSPVSGAFDLGFWGNIDDLRVEQRDLNRIVGGQVTMVGNVERSTEGTAIEGLTFSTPNLSGSLEGTLSSQTSTLTYQARLRDVGVISQEFSGPAVMNGTALGFGEVWQVNATASGPGNATLQVLGGIATAGTLALNVIGEGPLAAVNPFIAPRNLQGRGRAELAVNGPAALSSLLGTITVSGARLSAPTYRTAVEDINATVELGGSQARVNMTGNVEEGGQVAVTGPITLNAPYQADLQIRISDAVIIDPNLYETSLAGNIAFTGPLAGGARIAGALTLGPTEIQVPSSTVTTIGAIPDVTHINEPRAVRATRQRAGLLQAGANGGQAGPAYPLDLTVRAPGRIFIRGRGLDAELGGELQLTGTTQNVIASGRFELIRGRLDILQQRFQLDEGWAQLQGDFDPVIRLVATTETETGTASIVVSGLASAPEVSFESSPPLPQDEILAQLFFGRNIESLSALQALQLASAVATLAGQGDGGVVSRLRQNIGLDDLDVTSDAEGNTAVRAGTYITENIYTDVTVGSQGDTEINLNLDVTDNITVKGSVNDDGGTGIGLFFERDY
ncbi:translocation/assembly module TamB domain-containing protein [Pseudaestuariivita rosea]|uniref:translocation/assembly module TamB domain-containing protein n=1 Tax=Pseudaestuariivita rosea TaxID=2763263 RepID=UPI001ABB5E8D|nr:translocation/assembly module TamB domain-containing protein [Pseudaestuariivita rosea]